MSEWPTTGVALVHRNLALYLPGVDFAVTIVTPAEAAVLTSAAVDVTWTFAPGIQQTFRVEALLAGVVVYDSGIVNTATQAHTIPEGFLVTGNAYVIRVTVTTTDLNTGQGEVNVTTAFAPATNVVNVAVEAIGEDCDAPSVGAPELPGLRITWDQVVPAGAEVFVRYSVWRRVAGEADTDYVRIASITTISELVYTDYVVTSRVVYEYAVTWTALDGADTLVSLKQDPPPNGHTDFDFIWLHDWNTPTSHVQYFSLSSGVTIDQDQDEVNIWGRQAPTIFIGEKEFRRISVDGLPALHRGDLWTDLLALVSAQRTAGTVLVLRIGFSDEPAMFCQAVRTSKGNAEKQFEPSTDLVEVHLEEGVS